MSSKFVLLNTLSFDVFVKAALVRLYIFRVKAQLCRRSLSITTGERREWLHGISVITYTCWLILASLTRPNLRAFREQWHIQHPAVFEEAELTWRSNNMLYSNEV